MVLSESVIYGINAHQINPSQLKATTVAYQYSNGMINGRFIFLSLVLSSIPYCFTAIRVRVQAKGQFISESLLQPTKKAISQQTNTVLNATVD